MPGPEITRLYSPGAAEVRLLSVWYYVAWRLGRVRPANWRMRRLRSEFYEVVWRNAAAKAGAHFKSFKTGAAEIERDGGSIKVFTNKTSLDSYLTTKLVGDKPAVHALLARAGVPVPDHIVVQVRDFDRALETLRSSSLPLVVKPAADTGGGAGVSTNITSMRQLKSGIAWARAFGPRILIEKQIDGDCYRVLLMDGEVLDTVLRHPPTVTGDGVTTVRGLIDRENQLRLKLGTARAQTLIRFDTDVYNTLTSQGLTLDSRPAKAQIVKLKRVINENRSDENVRADGRLCPAIIQSARTAANVLGARLAGVDIICRDPGVPLQQTGGAVIEVNTAPGLYWHYHNAGSEFPAAEHILTRVFNKAPHRRAHYEPNLVVKSYVCG